MSDQPTETARDLEKRMGLPEGSVEVAPPGPPRRMGYDVEGAVDYQQGDVLTQGLAGYPTHPFTRVLRRVDGGFVDLPLRNWLEDFPPGYDDSWFMPPNSTRP